MSGCSTTNSSPPSRATMSALAGHAGERFGNLAEHIVAAMMAMGVVDRLEPVEIDVMQGELLVAAPSPGQFAPYAVAQHGAVGKAR